MKTHDMTQPSQSMRQPEAIPLTSRIFRFFHRRDTDALVLFGLPLLLVVGAILGIINLLSWIHLIAVLLNG